VAAAFRVSWSAVSFAFALTWPEVSAWRALMARASWMLAAIVEMCALMVSRFWMVMPTLPAPLETVSWVCWMSF
jgi:hypothetical protein